MSPDEWHGRRVLLVSREAPPAVGPHPIRVAKLIKYLPLFGWRATLLTVPVDHAWDVDPSLVDELGDTETIRLPRLFAGVVPPMRRRQPGGEGTDRAASRRSSRVAVARRILLPDRDLLWALPASRHAAGMAGRFDAVLTTAPPFSTHLVGYWATRHAGVPWVAEYRDNWSTNPLYHRDAVTNALNRALEHRLLRRADGVIAVSDRAAAEIQGFEPAVEDKLSVAPNGFDPDDLPAASGRPGLFEIAYAGTLDERRDPRPFFAALRLVALAEPGFIDLVRIRLMGNVSPWLADLARATLPSDHVSVDGQLPHREALNRLSRAAVLLGITTRAEAGGAGMTSKLFEYLGLMRPVLMLAPIAPARTLVEELGGGQTADPDDTQGIARAITRLFREWGSHDEHVAPAVRLVSLTRQVTASKVATALDAARTRRTISRAPRTAD